ncbi:MAG: sulfite exporter TauE/SafE family protein [Chloroflexi bacterium]|nr:sulfite exporter TauE/SafE family protein [Chloroflexota bacterium]
MTLEYWYMLPVGTLVATVAMAAGVGGATFFSPLFILALGLSPEVAIGTGLITEVFGFASGVYAYAHKRLIDYRLGVTLLIVTVPAAIFGTWVSGRADPDVLKVILGAGLFAVAASFLRAPERKDVLRMDKAIDEEYGGAKAETCLKSATGENICYTVCNKYEGRAIAGIGGLFVGMISTGLGELNQYFLLQRCRVPSRVSVATSVFVVAVTALTAAGGHLFQFMRTGGDVMDTVLSIVIFTVPGVIIGAQLGSAVSGRISEHTTERVLGVLFAIVALLTIGEVVL